MSDSPIKKSSSNVERKKDQIYIGHISRRMRERDLEKEFERFGKISNILLKAGFGFIVRLMLYRPSLIQRAQMML